MEKITIFDTTLRDGEQSPGASMDIKQKFEIALQLQSLGVDVMETGFPVSSPEQYNACKEIAENITESTVAVLARSMEKDIDIAAEVLKKAARSRIHTFVSTSPIHMKYKLKKKPEEVIEMARHAVRYARNKCGEIEFSPEDATRTDIDFLCRILEIAIQEGAAILNIPDTVGYTTPEEYAALITTIRNQVPNIDKAIISVHCHNDLGLAVANTVSAINAGARQAEVTINGIGERAGNAALEEVVMALNVRKDIMQVQTDIKTNLLYPTSRMLSTMIGFPIPRNKAIVGENAFAHEAGIHQHGMISHRETYEIMTPESVGREATKIVLGRHSGIHGFKKRLSELNIILNDTEMQQAYQNFLTIADKKREVFDEDLYAIVSEQLDAATQAYSIERFSIVTATNTEPSATVCLKTQNGMVEETASGDGPISALFRAINTICHVHPILIEYTVQAITPGKQAIGEAMVVIEIDEKRSSGRGSSTDILEASVKAYLNAINRKNMKEAIHP